MSDSLPRVDYFAMGGTIASVRTDPDALGAEPTLTAQNIVDGVPEVADVARVCAHQYLLRPSPEITVMDLLGLVENMRRAVDAGAVGVIVTQGTDSIEETSFAVDLLWDRDEPVVFTGAMRNPSLPGSEGPANLLGAVQLATSSDARGAGVLVTLNDEVHSARFVHKTHTSSPSTFQSPGLGPIGWISEGSPVIALRPARRHTLSVPAAARIPNVAVVRIGLADDCRLLGAVLDLGYDGVVIEALGGGHIPTAGLPMVDELVRRMPVVLTSRTGAGEVLSETYRFPGSEIDLLERGLIRAGALDAVKSRILLTLGLAAGHDNSSLPDLFDQVGFTTHPTR